MATRATAGERPPAAAYSTGGDTDRHQPAQPTAEELTQDTPVNDETAG